MLTSLGTAGTVAQPPVPGPGHRAILAIGGTPEPALRPEPVRRPLRRRVRGGRATGRAARLGCGLPAGLAAAAARHLRPARRRGARDRAHRARAPAREPGEPAPDG